MPFTPLIECLAPMRDRLVLAGGFAVNHHGYTRNTLDIDFVCVASDLPEIRRVLRTCGYTEQEEGPVAVHCRHSETGFRVDLLQVEEETFRELRREAVEGDLGGSLRMPTLCLSHLLAMKIHALAQQPEIRRDKDLMDIAWLTVLNDLSPEADLQPLCQRYGSPELTHEISRTLETLRP